MKKKKKTQKRTLKQRLEVLSDKMKKEVDYAFILCDPKGNSHESECCPSLH